MPIELTTVSTLLIAMFVIVGLSNTITEVIKLNISNPHPNVICTISSIVLTLVALIAYCQINAIAITWYLVVAGITFGFVCAFVSMSNFDKLISLFKKSGIPVDKKVENK